ncbi:DUF3575 domain-containing protein [Jiulongibacter sp. NS-SX5]|uniref:DUF3575 domain-containing protein n=1 Tax=Jiulongibacter sp. NS-SX5 TaxID=3463854 RepID=UPI00405970AF
MLKKLFFFFCFPVFVYAQDFPGNSLKVNVASAPFQLYSLQYERMLGNHFSFNNTFFYRPVKSIPFGTQADQIAKKHGLGVTGVDFEYIFVDLAEMGVKGYSPELRYYFGEKKNRAFIGLFGQYDDFDAKIPASLEVRYDGNTVELSKVPITFDIVSLSGGILIGKQFNFGERITLDVVLIGPHIGKAQSVYAVVEQSLLSELDESEKNYLKGKIIDRFKLNTDYYDVTIGDTKAEINANQKVKYAGLRGLGFNFGFRF